MVLYGALIFVVFWFYKSDSENFGFVPLELNALLEFLSHDGLKLYEKLSQCS